MIGLSVFKEYFKDYAEQYVLIGGAACDIIFEEQATAFRATKDLDMVLAPQFYRFDKPKAAGFPYMIELFSRTEDTLRGEDAGTCVSLPLGDEISSLSAILLNEEYYAMLLKGRTVLSDITVLSHTYLIPFKAKAWLDLRERKDSGQHVDEKDIRKHKNDTLRLSTLLTGTEQCDLSEPVRRDIALFIDSLRIEPVDLKTLKISGIKFEDILTVLSQVYLK